MNLLLCLSLTLPLWLLCQASAATPPARLDGMQISLTTHASRITLPPVGTAAREPVLSVSVVLVNRGGRPIPFVFRDEGAALTKFVFSVFDAADQLVWAGPGQVSGRGNPLAGVEQALRPRSSWIARTRVPLRTEDAWWEPGRYRIEATLDAEPAVSAAGVFEIVAAPVANPVKPEPRPQPSAMPVSSRVLSVDAVMLSRVTLGNGTPGLRVEARGMANSGGWSAPRLVEQPSLMIYPPPPLAFDFVATPPTGMATMALAPVRATVDIPWPTGVRMVTVRGAQNAMSQPLPVTAPPVH